MIDRRGYTSIQRVLRDQKAAVPLRGVWKIVLVEYGIGREIAGKLHLTSGDRADLRSVIRKEIGADPLSEEVPATRIGAVSAGFRDEKLAKAPVFEGMALVCSAQGAITLSSGDAFTPPGCLLMSPLADLSTLSLATVVVVENGAVARHWSECILPHNLDNALMVYRGHSEDHRAVKNWLATLPPYVLRVGFFDFDPAGLGLSTQYQLDGILIPDRRDDLPLTGGANKPDAHTAQVIADQGLPNRLPPASREILSWMTNDNRRCAVTQEWLMVNQWPLTFLPFS